MSALTLARPALLALLLAASAAAADTKVACAPDRAAFTLPDGSTRDIAVEVVDTPDSRARGLMFRESLAPEHGMLFIYEAPSEVAFWMRNTLIPLDMLFIDPAGRVAHVAANAVPHDETPVPGAHPGDPAPERLMVLEIGGGEAARLGLGEGAILSHPRLPQDIAALPCE
ncbi:DUF192 domain-containing protein [Paracoccus suum]|uniref:DUF192 domain-containing protein n=1 Tax=Paracoccus suum TaxID=2259340 RepID=A0A344PKD9_9RHOB|nr:DUF192 domain-containing protein [Paracoccus suum]AXC49844.1 DUF192 domain-containing protein [Paracoccus suum]